jgi:hypothetical protein
MARLKAANLFNDADRCGPEYPVLKIYKPSVVHKVPIKLPLYTTLKSYYYIDFTENVGCKGIAFLNST